MWVGASSLLYVWFTLFISTTSNSAALILPPQVEYKYDKEMMKGCVIPVVDDKLTLLAMKNNEMASTVSLSTSLLASLWWTDYKRDLELFLTNKITAKLNV